MSLQRSDYETIGKLYLRHNSADALSILETYRATQAKALDNDLGNISYYFDLFCKIHTILPSDYIGSLQQAPKIDKRRLFIAAMILVYMPDLLYYNVPRRPGLSKALGDLLQYNPGNLNKTIKEVVEWMRHGLYGFKEQVLENVEQLTGKQLQEAA